MSAVGWVEISPGALRRLKRSLDTSDEERGVVDEIGVLAFHEKYAESFFPGTSVLHRRARYLLFVPWTYLFLASKRCSRLDLTRTRATTFQKIARQLKKDPDARGIIGRDVAEPAQPPDAVYWRALRTYGLCSDVERSRVVGRWDPDLVRRPKPRAYSDEPEDGPLLELYVPERPYRCPNTPFSFQLEREEAEWLRRAVAVPGRSLLSEAARMLRRGERPAEDAHHLWADEFMMRVATRLGPEWGAAVTRAKHIAHLGQLARAVYAVHVERTCATDVAESRPKHRARKTETEIRTEDDDSYEERLRELVDAREGIRWAGRADFETDFNPRQLGLAGFELFRHLRDRAKSIRSWPDARAKLLDRRTRFLLEEAERARKRSRARLPLRDGRARRASFGLNDVTADPLHYRWRVARQFLIDLHDGLFQ